MTNILKKVINRTWKLTDSRDNPAYDFLVRLDEVDQTENPGRCADIFFGNTNEVVWKWLQFLPIYDRVFGPFVGKPIRFLEIGVFQGGSLRMWRDYFGPEATIFGIDINPDCAAFNGRSGQVRIGSQDDPEFLRSVVEEMGGVDIVLDDGSHYGDHQRASFEALFPLMADGGVYLIEDLHTSYWPSFEGGMRREGTGIEFLKQKVDAMHRQYLPGGVNTSDAMEPIECVQFFDSIAVVEKRRQKPRASVMVPDPGPVSAATPVRMRPAQ
jgi:hypothetical protein